MATYDPKKVIVTVGTSPILGFASGTFVSFDFNEDAINLLVGTQGEYAYAVNRNKSGVLTLTLMHTAQSNDILEAFAAADEADGGGIGRPASVKDVNGRTLLASKDVRILKRPTIEFGAEVASREWTLVGGAWKVTVGGNLL